MEHVHIDGHGSTRQLIDNTGTPAGINDSFSYDAYGVMLGGNPVDTSGSTSLLYAGEQFDTNAQMYYNRARWYNPLNGRFNRTDPYAGNTQDPQSLHKYAYAHANPINGIDPSGNSFLGIAGLAVYYSSIAVLFMATFFTFYHVGLSFRGSIRYNGTCGPDVKEQLETLRGKIINNNWDVEKKEAACDNMYSMSTDEAKGWEITELHYENTPKGTGDCGPTVSVDGHCYSVHEVNYYLWGSINKTCDNGWWTTQLFAFSYSTFAPLVAWSQGKAYHGSAFSKTNWSSVGYKDNFNKLIPFLSEYSSCKCDENNIWANTNQFTAIWGGETIQ